MEKSEITIPEIIEQVKMKMCDDYCKWPKEYGGRDNDDLIYEKCEDRPLGRLGGL